MPILLASMKSERSCELPCESSPSPSPPPPWCSAEEPANPLEIEAAETLADLAQFAVKERGSEFPNKMRDKGKLVRKRVKSESPPSRPEFIPFDSVASRPQHVIEKDGDVLTRQHEKTCESVALKVVKSDENAGSYNLNCIYPSRYSSFGGGRTRQTLTEAEKEEKRLRRVLANRESARRTIRRRQALCEELSRKAAELAQENEELKKGREAALNEYRLLGTINEQLKRKIAKAMEPQIIQTPAQLQAVCPEFSAPLTNCPMVLYNGSFKSVFWPTTLQSPIPGQSQEGPAIPPPMPSNIIMPALFKPDPFQEQDPLINAPLPRAPVYVIPYPLLFPVPDQADGNRCQSACHPKQGKVPSGNPCNATSSSKRVEPFIEGGAVLPSAVKSVLPRVAEIRLAEDLNQMPAENDPYGCEQQVDASSEDRVQFRSSEHSSIVKDDNGPDIDIVRANREPVPSQSGHTAFVKREDCFQLGVSCSKKRIDAVAAAAKARRKRKELTKLKSFQVRHFQMQC